MARTCAYLFALGGALGLVTLVLPGAPDRDELGMVITAALAFATALAFVVGFDRLPIGVFKVVPVVGALLVTAAIGFGGATAAGAYAMFFFWVVLAACYFFGLRLALVQIGFCVACYGFVFLVAEPDAPQPGLYWLIGAGTLLIAGVLMVGLRRQMESLVTQLADAAGTDSLTGLANRREFDDSFARELERSTRTGRPLGLVVLDLDWFKEINDMLGHVAGDRVLVKLATVLRRETRGMDTVARFGGEEFAVIAPEAGEDEVFALAERLRRKVRSAFAEHARPLTISCGVSSFPAAGASARDLLRAADRALYSAKELGRDRSIAYHAGETEIEFPETARQPRRASSRVASLVSLADAMDRRKGSPGHSRLVGRCAEVLARRLGLDEAEVEVVSVAGLLHDIGTVGVSESTLLEEGPLSEEQWAEVRRHPEIGARMVGTELEGVREAILAHHERIDGSGYPFGRRGDEIPLAAQIVGVTDAFAAMIGKRTYGPTITLEAAFEELQAHSGRQFMPAVVDAFVSLDGDLGRVLEAARRSEPQPEEPDDSSEASSSESATK